MEQGKAKVAEISLNLQMEMAFEALVRIEEKEKEEEKEEAAWSVLAVHIQPNLVSVYQALTVDIEKIVVAVVVHVVAQHLEGHSRYQILHLHQHIEAVKLFQLVSFRLSRFALVILPAVVS